MVACRNEVKNTNIFSNKSSNNLNNITFHLIIPILHVSEYISFRIFIFRYENVTDVTFCDMCHIHSNCYFQTIATTGEIINEESVSPMNRTMCEKCFSDE